MSKRCPTCKEWSEAFSLFGIPDPDVTPQSVTIRLERAENERDNLLLKVAELSNVQPEGFAKLRAMVAKQRRLEYRDGLNVWRELKCDACNSRMLYNNGDERDVTCMDVGAVKCWNCGSVKVFDGGDADVWEYTFKPPY